MLFEMGACSSSVAVGKEDGGQKATGEDASAGEAAFAPTEEGEEDRDEMLTFIVPEGEGWEDLGAALKAACELAGGQDGCFGEIYAGGWLVVFTGLTRS